MHTQGRGCRACCAAHRLNAAGIPPHRRPAGDPETVPLGGMNLDPADYLEMGAMLRVGAGA